MALWGDDGVGLWCVRALTVLIPKTQMLNTELNRAGGEAFVLRRGGVSCEIEVAGLPLLCGAGEVVLSTKRILFVNSVPVRLGGNGAVFTSFELPLASMFQEQFNQPIFSANNLTGQVNTTGLPAPQARFKLSFTQGGCGTFLHFFYSALQESRRGSESNKLEASARHGRLQADNAAFLDPNDTSVIYVAAQPPSL
ncbi:hypothetical protein BASA81_005839 [Batrachochytrium salamandrivorans]|nr:hypothetical protein BASA81_005839 [Batrachochytrium salamandrivorans]